MPFVRFLFLLTHFFLFDGDILVVYIGDRTVFENDLIPLIVFRNAVADVSISGLRYLQNVGAVGTWLVAHIHVGVDCKSGSAARLLLSRVRVSFLPGRLRIFNTCK